MSALAKQAPAPGAIMIVDDNPANLKLLEDMLLREGHEVCAFPRGRLALAAATQNPPDLILLDINMPEMNGYEVCQRLKSAPELAGIPVIFLSALSETQDKVKGFQSGAVDYISKPFQFEEVHARVATHLKLHNLERALRLQNENLEQVVAARTRELSRANERLTMLDDSKNAFLGLISHELRTPLNGLLGVGELLLEGAASTAEKNNLQGLYDRSRRRILSMLEDASLLTEIDVRGERFTSTLVSLSGVLNRAIKSTTEFAESGRVTLPPPTADLGVVAGDADLLARAFQALLQTSVKFSKRGGIVRLSTGATTDSRTVIIESHGTTIPDPALGRFFDLFSIREAMTPGGDLGIGPPLARRILSLFGGSVSVANGDPPGITLTISLRDAAPA